MRSHVVTLVVILVVVAGVGIGLSLVLLGANMVTGFTSMASALVAAIGIISAPWLAPRSGPVAVACSVAALGATTLAALLLVSSPPNSSNLWVLINVGRFGGLIAAGLGIALSLHAAVVRSIGPSRAFGLFIASVIALAIGIAVAGWENR
jgi:hypothetical protein